MSNFRLVMNRGALYDIRRAPRVQADLVARARAVAEGCGGAEAGYLVGNTQGRKNPQGRWRATVFTSTVKAMVDNRRNNTLVRNFGRARG